ncbi:MAG TPA: sulfite exporter TauE/SafE family protein [Alphaproteobacteria bacterium]|jgi:sulfite exporter TauE/SafE|nr:sulfite exporter TauE/SafE family protein [Alphaproteobacteria bacterium]
MNNFWIPFLTGLTTGGVSCFAVQGGLLTSALANEEEINVAKKLRIRGLLVFLIAKLIAYTLLGLLLGFVGSQLIITPKIQGWFQIAVGIYMLVTAANLANLHPIFRYFVIRPPKFIFRLLRDQTKVKSFFTPALLGALTVFIPCGVTQGIMLLAISASNPGIAALIMFSFILGTIPVFFTIGIAANELFTHKAFLYIAALVVAIMGILSINSGQILRGSVHTFQNYYLVIFKSGQTAKVGNVVNITITNGGYKADVNTLKIGVPVKLILKTNNVTSCARVFTIPNLNYSKVLPSTGSTEMTFTPTKLGKLTYTCSMGMYSGQFTIIN